MPKMQSEKSVYKQVLQQLRGKASLAASISPLFFVQAPNLARLNHNFHKTS